MRTTDFLELPTAGTSVLLPTCSGEKGRDRPIKPKGNVERSRVADLSYLFV